MRTLATLATAGLVAQAVNLLATPVVGRIYGPENVGILQVFLAKAAIWVQGSTIGLHLAVVPAESDTQAARDATTAVSSVVFVAGVMVTMQVFVPGVFFSRDQLSHLGSLAWLLPIAVLVGGLNLVLDQCANRLGAYSIKAQSMVGANIVGQTLKIGGGLVFSTAGMLVSAATLQAILVMLAIGARQQMRAAAKLLRGNWNQFASSWQASRAYILWRTPEQVLNAATQGIPVILVGSLYSVQAAGQLGMAMALLTPANVLGKAVADIVAPAVTKLHKNGASTYPYLAAGTWRLAVYSLPIFAAIAITSEDMLPYVLGADWDMVGAYVSWVCLWTWSVVVNKAAVAAIPVLGIQRELLIYTVISLTARAGVVSAAAELRFSVVGAVGALCVVCALLNAALVGYTLRVARQRSSVECRNQ